MTEIQIRSAENKDAPEIAYVHLTARQQILEGIDSSD